MKRLAFQFLLRPMAVAGLLLLWMGMPALASASPEASQSTAPHRGQALYAAKCAQCHGDKGDAQGVGADLFRPLPRDFTTGIYKVRGTPSGELPTRQDLVQIIRRGMPMTGMPAWPHLSDAEVDDLAAYLETFSEDFADTTERAKPIEIGKVPEFNPAHIAEGRKLFEANKCFDCHGQQGRGDGESAPSLSDDWGYAIRPADLTKPWAFRGGARREDIYRTLSTGFNGTPMPSFAQDMTPEERWKVVDYVQSLSGAHNVPVGQAPFGVTVVAVSVPDVGKVLAEANRDSLFALTTETIFPIVGQVIEDPRCFAPGVNAVTVRAVYDSQAVALQLRWHDMTAEIEGENSPLRGSMDTAKPVSDAVALQFPFKPLEGKVKPYFYRGDKKNPVVLGFADLAKSESAVSQAYAVRGGGDYQVGSDSLPYHASYHEGEWRVTWVVPRQIGKAFSFDSETFIPMAISIWDGSLKETGSRHGLTSWYSLYLQKPQTQKPWVPAARAGSIALFLQFAAVLGLRRLLRSKQKNPT
jgi:DMSO reductase family type II enzyme heme b subunit